MDSNNTIKPRAVSLSEGSKEKSANVNQRQESLEGHAKRDHSPEIDSSGERLFKKHDNSEDKLLREQSFVRSVLAASFPSYNCSSVDNLFPDNHRQALSMRSPCNMMVTVNSPCAGNSFDGMALNQHNVRVGQHQPMAAETEIVQSSTSSKNPCAFIEKDSIPPQENIYFPPIKEVVNLTNCILYPPSPNAPRPSTRQRPLGCKTAFVGGLPEKITEEILKEIFERCGTVETIRMSRKNFCHIRFSEELHVEKAFYLSGYRLKMENKDEAAFTGTLHVDYAQARDDQYDYECKQRALQNQARHQGLDYYRPPTPPVVHYTDHEASLICEKLKNGENFTLASTILITWLEKGEISKENASSFFSMIQSTHYRVGKLLLNKLKYEDQLNEAKIRWKKELEGIICQFTEIENVYKAASLQKCWDQFTLAQRKTIQMFKKHTEELKNAHVEDLINECQDEEIDLGDDNSEADLQQCKDDAHKVLEEVNFMKGQLEATQDQIMFMQAGHNEELFTDNQMMQTLQNLKKEALNMSQTCVKIETKFKELCQYLGQNNRKKY